MVVRVTIGVHIVSCGTFFAGQAWKRASLMAKRYGQKAATDICNSLGFAFKALVRTLNSVIPYLIIIKMTLAEPFEPTSTWNSLPFIGKSWLSFDVKILLGCAYLMHWRAACWPQYAGRDLNRKKNDLKSKDYHSIKIPYPKIGIVWNSNHWGI